MVSYLDGKDIVSFYLGLITCEKNRDLQLCEIYRQIRSIKDKYLSIFEKYDRITPCLENQEILKLFVLYYIHIYEIYRLIKGKYARGMRKIDSVFSENEEYRDICCDILTQDTPISSDRLNLMITYLNNLLKVNQTFSYVEQYCMSISRGNTIYIPGCFKLKIGDIIDGIMSDTMYSYIYFDDCFTSYIPHDGTSSVSYSDHDIEHHYGVMKTIDDNLEFYVYTKNLYKSILSERGNFSFRCLAVIIFMYYHEGMPRFNGFDFITDSFMHEEIKSDESNDLQQLIKYIIKAPDVDLSFRASILDAMEEGVEVKLQDKKYIHVSNLIVEKFRSDHNDLYTALL